MSAPSAAEACRARARTLARASAAFVVLGLLAGIGALLLTGMVAGDAEAGGESALLHLPLFLALACLAAAIASAIGAMLSARTAERLGAGEMEERLSRWQAESTQDPNPRPADKE